MSHPDPTLAAHLAHYPELAEHAKGWRHPFDTQALSDKVILVTGAGDGLGAATAKTYATFGATVVLLGRTRLKLEAVNDWISTNTATQPVIVPCDLETLDLNPPTTWRTPLARLLASLMVSCTTPRGWVRARHWPTTPWKNG